MSENREVRLVALDEISTEGCQTRSSLRQAAVDEYAGMLADGVEFDPAVVFDDGERLHLSAGHHRYHAYVKAKRREMLCIVIKNGSKWDAIKFGIQDNLKHRGVLLTRADKRANIEIVLRCQPTLADSAIAELCGVTNKTVGSVRKELESTGEIPKSTIRTGSDGRTYNTSNYRTKPDNDSQKPTYEPVMDDEHCSCGGTWVSDGEGGRYCEKCYADYPLSHGGDTQPTRTDEKEYVCDCGCCDDCIDRVYRERKEREGLPSKECDADFDRYDEPDDGVSDCERYSLQQDLTTAWNRLCKAVVAYGRVSQHQGVQTKLDALDAEIRQWLMSS